ncbi:Hypothetical predicted protein [Podarcis lilfordi]|uniref:Uncharacterized protein n=1 Tax=Podarcis lilfordi TaxID=74358 RepID=A0AA35PBG3_9SAUR|nr:Hypothetical predicted protein [Podarcis lilfordi]
MASCLMTQTGPPLTFLKKLQRGWFQVCVGIDPIAKGLGLLQRPREKEPILPTTATPFQVGGGRVRRKGDQKGVNVFAAACKSCAQGKRKFKKKFSPVHARTPGLEKKGNSGRRWNKTVQSLVEFFFIVGASFKTLQFLAGKR